MCTFWLTLYIHSGVCSVNAKTGIWNRAENSHVCYIINLIVSRLRALSWPCPSPFFDHTTRWFSFRPCFSQCASLNRDRRPCRQCTGCGSGWVNVNQFSIALVSAYNYDGEITFRALDYVHCPYSVRRHYWVNTNCVFDSLLFQPNRIRTEYSVNV